MPIHTYHLVSLKESLNLHIDDRSFFSGSRWGHSAATVSGAPQHVQSGVKWALQDWSCCVGRRASFSIRLGRVLFGFCLFGSDAFEADSTLTLSDLLNFLWIFPSAVQSVTLHQVFSEPQDITRVFRICAGIILMFSLCLPSLQSTVQPLTRLSQLLTVSVLCQYLQDSLWGGAGGAHFEDVACGNQPSCWEFKFESGGSIY